MNKKPAQLQRLHQHRPGEGHVIDVTVTAGGDGETGSLDLAALPVPDRRYVAEAVGLQVTQHQVRLLFGQRHVMDNEWLSLLAINMSFESVAQLLGATPDSFAEQYFAYAKNLPTAELTEFSTKADQSVVVTASIVLAGYTGTNGCMDFYYTSPFSMQHLATIKKLAVESVVRVNLPSSMLFAIIQALRDAVPKFPKFSGASK